MSAKVLIFPNQLFNQEQYQNLVKKYIKKPINQVQFYLVEEPIYFSRKQSKGNSLKLNKLKLVLHRASMKYFDNYLKEQIPGINLDYHEYSQLVQDNESLYPFLKKGDQVVAFDPVDYALEEKLEEIKKKHSLVSLDLVDSPNFLATPAELAEFAKGREEFFHKDFYEWQKAKLGILEGVKSYDKENRQKFPKGMEIPPLPANDNATPWVQEAMKYVNQHFPDHYGDVKNFIFPVTHQSSEEWFYKFLEKRFINFGAYQDAMLENNDFLFHSMIAPMLNVGLLDPKWILAKMQEYQKKHQVAMNNYEGFVRQLIGWRDYSYMLYLFQYDAMVQPNYFGNDRGLTEKWYTAQTGIFPIDDTIDAAFHNGYLHHILRLMMMSNFMNLCNMHPDEVYRWFMEFSCDSYDWVMINNVYSMGMWADGGLTMRKPYISSDKYILKMSDFKKDGYWEKVWNDLFYYFLYRNEKQIQGTPYQRNLYHWNNKSKEEQDRIIKDSQTFINSITSDFKYKFDE